MKRTWVIIAITLLVMSIFANVTSVQAKDDNGVVGKIKNIQQQITSLFQEMGLISSGVSELESTVANQIYKIEELQDVVQNQQEQISELKEPNDLLDVTGEITDLYYLDGKPCIRLNDIARFYYPWDSSSSEIMRGQLVNISINSSNEVVSLRVLGEEIDNATDIGIFKGAAVDYSSARGTISIENQNGVIKYYYDLLSGDFIQDLSIGDTVKLSLDDRDYVVNVEVLEHSDNQSTITGLVLDKFVSGFDYYIKIDTNDAIVVYKVNNDVFNAVSEGDNIELTLNNYGEGIAVEIL